VTPPIWRGHIYWVTDKPVQLPPNTAEGRAKNPHETRPFLVTSADSRNHQADWPVLSGFPISHEQKYATQYDIEIQPGEGGMKKRCWVLVTMFQPLAKSAVQDEAGRLLANVVEECMAALLDYNDSLA
jgi:mRNA-degrading endonuclease toxin of MazEF toxin-antitoxin module